MDAGGGVAGDRAAGGQDDRLDQIDRPLVERLAVQRRRLAAVQERGDDERPGAVRGEVPVDAVGTQHLQGGVIRQQLEQGGVDETAVSHRSP